MSDFGAETPNLCLSCYWNPAKTGHICEKCLEIDRNRRLDRQNSPKYTKKGPKMTELAPEIDGKEAEMPRNEGENGPEYHSKYTAQLRIAPTFNTETGERLENTESLEYNCKDCDWSTSVFDPGTAGLHLILHTLGIDNLDVEWLDAKDFGETADFDMDNPEEVLERLRSMKEAQGEDDATGE